MESKNIKTRNEKKAVQAGIEKKRDNFEATLTPYARDIYKVLVEEKNRDKDKFVSYLPELRHSAIDPNDGELKYWDCFKVKGIKDILAVSQDFDCMLTTLNGMISREVVFIGHEKY